MIIGYYGAQGSGKTLSMVKDMYDLHVEGYKTLSNLKLSFDHKIITYKDLEEYTKSKEQLLYHNIAIDEVHLWFNSRRSMSKKNVILSYMVAQMRKKGNYLFYTSQTVRKPDIILKEETDIFHFPELMIDVGNFELKPFNGTYYDKIPEQILPLIWVKDRIVIKDTVRGLDEYREKTRYFKAEDYVGLYDTTFIIGFE